MYLRVREGNYHCRKWTGLYNLQAQSCTPQRGDKVDPPPEIHYSPPLQTELVSEETWFWTKSHTKWTHHGNKSKVLLRAVYSQIFWHTVSTQTRVQTQSDGSLLDKSQHCTLCSRASYTAENNYFSANAHRGAHPCNRKLSITWT